MDFLKAEIERKKRLLEEAKLVGPEKKYFKRGELAAKQREDYLALHAPKVEDVRKKVEEIEKAKQEGRRELIQSTSASVSRPVEQQPQTLSRGEVVRRFRDRFEPILLFGESVEEAADRLKKLEEENTEKFVGIKNNFKEAQAKVDEAYLNELESNNDTEEDRKGKSKSDSHVSNPKYTYEELVNMSSDLAKGDIDLDYKVMGEFIKVMMSLWKSEMEKRPEPIKRSVKGKMELGTFEQTKAYLKPLCRMIKKETVPDDIRDSLSNLVKYTLQRDYIMANEAYMEMAIGNAPWPIGVTNAGIHARPGREKIFSKNVAHVLNDELQRKFIQGLKRLITKSQQYYPTDPSRSIDYVRSEDQ